VVEVELKYLEVLEFKQEMVEVEKNILEVMGV
jgi:hypothetical protein